MNVNGPCSCGRAKKLKKCCLPLINGISKPKTAEDLMRSRYTAFSLANEEYILKTYHIKTRPTDPPGNIEKWAKSVEWQKLEVIATEDGQFEDTFGKVTFKAHYIENGKNAVIFEESKFEKNDDQWLYVSGNYR